MADDPVSAWPPRRAWLSDLRWPDAAAGIREGRVVVVPIGAACKAHGPHLPLDTDRQLAIALASGVAAALPVLVAPVIDVGFYPAFVEYPGSQSIRSSTFIALATDVLSKLVRDGARRIAVINTGVSTEAPLALAARDVLEQRGVTVHIADIRSLGHAARHVLEQPRGGHADEQETSIMLAIDPTRVRMQLAQAEPEEDVAPNVFRHPLVLRDDPRAGPSYSRTGATGDPTLATAQKGRQLLDAMIADLVAGLRATFPDAPGMCSSCAR
ncbi:MAG: creatininase family protein [Gammaproteobacteria bacterium]|nr:creatininase family protein [Gammaproteobacteria bacterium]